MADVSMERIQRIERKMTALLALLARAGSVNLDELEATELELEKAERLVSDEETTPNVQPAWSPAKPPEPPKPEPQQICHICGKPATRIIFSNAGNWTLCEKSGCLDKLCEQNDDSDSRLTWLQRPLKRG